jgi:hypothetical protein
MTQWEKTAQVVAAQTKSPPQQGNKLKIDKVLAEKIKAIATNNEEYVKLLIVAQQFGNNSKQ